MSKLYQIGIPVHELSTVYMEWFTTLPREKFIISPSKKDDNLCVLETRDRTFAASVVKDLPDARVHVEECLSKIIKI
ncbi:MAG: hypothetical protein IKR18_11675 [Bacteroidaceae bacterium]|nr:hypothetical protein [Bacteroidaceae bacterium]